MRRGLLRWSLDRGSHQQTLQNIEQIVEARQVPQVSEDGHKHGGQDGARASEEDAGEAGPPQPQEALRARSKHPDAAVRPWWSQTPLPPPHTPQFVHLGNGGSSDPCWGEDESGVGGFPSLGADYGTTLGVLAVTPPLGNSERPSTKPPLARGPSVPTSITNCPA